jgi:hypothetical protein
MKLLATSTPTASQHGAHSVLRQSITNQNWTKIVSEDLRKRFPHANLIIENRSIGGFSSQILWKTGGVRPVFVLSDLVIFTCTAAIPITSASSATFARAPQPKC